MGIQLIDDFNENKKNKGDGVKYCNNSDNIEQCPLYDNNIPRLYYLLLTFYRFMLSYNQGLGENSLDHSRRGEFLAIFLRVNLI